MLMKHGVDIGLPNAPLGLGNKPWLENDVQEILDRIAAVTGMVSH
jgi:N-acetylneuraminate lyase